MEKTRDEQLCSIIRKMGFNVVDPFEEFTHEEFELFQRVLRGG